MSEDKMNKDNKNHKDETIKEPSKIQVPNNNGSEGNETKMEERVAPDQKDDKKKVKKDKKEQKIVVLVTFSPADKNLILSGVNLAVAFGKELCIACRLNKKERKNHHLFKQKLIDYTLPLKKELPGLKTPVLLLYTTIRHLPEVLADDHEAIVIIAASNLFRSYSKAVPVSPVPFLFIPSGAPLSSFRNIVIPVDLRKENSDSLLWCSWFGRFNQSEITLIAASEKRKETQRLVARNVLLAKNLFQKFNVAHKLFRGEKGVCKTVTKRLNSQDQPTPTL